MDGFWLDGHRDSRGIHIGKVEQLFVVYNKKTGSLLLSNEKKVFSNTPNR
jgi:hypothetical protein